MTGETMSTDIDALLRHADPMARVPDAALEPTLASARQAVERRRRPQPRAAHWPRVLVLSGALAATAAVVAVAVGPGISGPADQSQRTAGLLPVAVAADGQIVEQAPYATAIAPKDADLRLLPTYLPPGWSYKDIYARTQTATDWDVPASLVATTTGTDGTVTASLMVTGPVQATIKTKGSAADVVDGHPARLFAAQEVPEWAGYQFSGRTWWWSDAQGKQWQATSENLSPDEAQRAVKAVRTDGDQITWEAPADSGLEVVHQRRGPAYSPTSSGLEWHLSFTDGQHEHNVSINRQDGRDPLPVTTVFPAVGGRPTTVNGHLAVLRPAGQGPQEALATGLAAGQGSEKAVQEPVPGAPTCWWSDYQIAEGVSAGLRACGQQEQDQVAKMLASLTNVPADDPRLSTYALDR